ncbi:MAG TPA: SDR family NAD(P)-dependent oxidoreductase, partial [Planctomycetaceae bacterium]
MVVVTGSSAGVGRAIAREFGRHGAKVGLVARGEDGLNAAVGEIERLGGRAVAVPTDVADHDAVEAAARRVEEEFGPIDVWVNNAMTSVFSPVKEMKPEEFKRVTEVTYLGVVYGTLAALVVRGPDDRFSGDLRLVDGRHRLRLVRQAALDPVELRRVQRRHLH